MPLSVYPCIQQVCMCSIRRVCFGVNIRAEAKMLKRMYIHRQSRQEKNLAHYYRELRKLVCVGLGPGGKYVSPEKYKTRTTGIFSGLMYMNCHSLNIQVEKLS